MSIVLKELHKLHVRVARSGREELSATGVNIRRKNGEKNGHFD